MQRTPVDSDRVLNDSDLCRTIMGIEIFSGGLLVYLAFILAAAIGKVGSGFALLLMGVVIAGLGALPLWRSDVRANVR